MAGSITNVTPADGATDFATTGIIGFTMVPSPGQNVDLTTATVKVYINQVENLVYDGDAGGFQTGWDNATSTYALDGSNVNFTIKKTTPFAAGDECILQVQFGDDDSPSVDLGASVSTVGASATYDLTSSLGLTEFFGGTFSGSSGFQFTVTGRAATTAVFTGTVASASGSAQPYALTDGMTLQVAGEGAGTETATFNTADFTDISNATAQEVVDVLATDCPSVVGVPFFDNPSTSLRIYGTVLGTDGRLNIVGGTALSGLGLSTGITSGSGTVTNFLECPVAEVTSLLDAASGFASATHSGGRITLAADSTTELATIDNTVAAGYPLSLLMKYEDIVHTGYESEFDVVEAPTPPAGEEVIDENCYETSSITTTQLQTDIAGWTATSIAAYPYVNAFRKSLLMLASKDQTSRSSTHTIITYCYLTEVGNLLNKITDVSSRNVTLPLCRKRGLLALHNALNGFYGLFDYALDELLAGGVLPETLEMLRGYMASDDPRAKISALCTAVVLLTYEINN